MSFLSFHPLCSFHASVRSFSIYCRPRLALYDFDKTSGIGLVKQNLSLLTALQGKGLIIKRYINSSAYFCLLYLGLCSIV